MEVVLAAIHVYQSPQAVPLANAFLKTYLTTDEELSGKVSVTLKDFLAGQETATCVAAILANNPDAVGFSMYLWNREKCRDIAIALRRQRPDMTLFAGGPEPTGDPEGVLRDAPFDFLILGEGEIPFLEAMARLSEEKEIAGIRGIALPQAGGCNTSPERPVALLDTIPSPYLAGTLDPATLSGVLWQLSRGCDFGCDFCFDQQGKGSVRLFSLERIRAELALFVRNRVAQVFVLDSTFNRNMQRAKAILRLIGKTAPHIHFHFEARSEFIDAEMAGLFAQATCSLQIGLQSADAEVNRKVGRRFGRADFARKINLLNEAGAIFGFDLIYGLPGDTLRGFAASLDFAIGLAPNHLDIFPLAVLPGAPLATRARAIRLCHQETPPYTVYSSPGFPARDMARATALATACDIFYSRGKAVAWFGTIIAALDLSPSAFFRDFWHWLKRQRGTAVNETDLSDEEIWQAQRSFVSRMYGRRALHDLLPAALDLIDYHYHYAAALLAPPPEIPTEREVASMDLLAEHFAISPGAHLARFSYEIFDILEAGEIDLRDFVACFTPNGSWAVIYVRGDEVFTESLIEPFFRLLDQLDGRNAAGPLASALGIPSDEACSFLEFAVAEGIICRAMP
jgi:hypothetical protein